MSQLGPSAASMLPNSLPETVKRQVDATSGRCRTSRVIRHAQRPASQGPSAPDRDASDHVAVTRRELRDNWAANHPDVLPEDLDEGRPHLGRSALGVRRGLARLAQTRAR